jgi:hypothetical protein
MHVRSGRLADIQGVNQVHREYRLVPLSTKVELELAEQLMRMADDGDRTLSREIRRALIEHIAKAGSSADREASA